MDRLDDMIAFIRVVEARSFTAAAERLGLSKSVVSRRLTELENRLGARLLNRTTRSLSLTPAGQSFYERARSIVADVEDAEQVVAELNRDPRGLLRVNAPMSFGMRHLAPAVAQFLDRHPSVELDMELTDRFVDMVEEGWDVAIRIGRLRDSSLIARRLAPCRMLTCGSPAYVALHGQPEHPDDLGRFDCLLYSAVSNPNAWSYVIDGELRSVRVQGRVRVNNGDVLVEAAMAGLGFAVVPSFMCCDEIASGRLIPVLSAFEPRDMAVHAVWPHHRHLSTKVRAFVDFLAQRFGPEPYWDTPLCAGRSDEGERRVRTGVTVA